MKIRSGFVSNSSSSSFICDCCGENHSGYDISLSECEMVECKNGHVFCEEHMTEEGKVYLNRENEGATDDFDPYEVRYEMDSNYCPCCNFDELADSDVIAYLKKVTGKDELILKAELKSLFTSYEKFLDYLKEEK